MVSFDGMPSQITRMVLLDSLSTSLPSVRWK
jgi:hypothetical protein